MSWRARVAESACLSSTGSVAPRPMTWECAGFPTLIGSRLSAATPARNLNNPESEEIRRLIVFGAASFSRSQSRQERTSATLTREERRRVLGPLPAHEGDEGEHVFTVGPLRVCRFSPPHPGLKDTGYGRIEALDRRPDSRYIRACEDRRQIRASRTTTGCVLPINSLSRPTVPRD